MSHQRREQIQRDGLTRPKPGETDIDVIGTGSVAPTIEGLPIVKPPWGRITAIDLNRGDIAWQIPNGDTPPNVRNHPLLKGVTLPKTGSPSRAGLLVTKTLLFAGEGYEGQPKFRAYDKKTGDIVWEADIPQSQNGITDDVLHRGKQCIVFAVQGSSNAHGSATCRFCAAVGGCGRLRWLVQADSLVGASRLRSLVSGRVG